MSKSFKRAVFGISVALVVVVFLGGFVSNGVSAGSQNDGVYRQMGVYEEVLHKVQSDYVTDPNINKVTTGALHGLLESLDSDSSYLTPAGECRLQGPSERRDRASRTQRVAPVWLRDRCFGDAGQPGREGTDHRRRHHRVDWWRIDP